MANIIKDVVVSESAPIGKPGCLWIKYTPGTNSYQTMLPVGNGWQETNETLSKAEIEGGLGYTPENSGNKVTSLSTESTDTQYPSAKTVYDAIQNAGGDTQVETTIPAGGMLPNVVYELGTVTNDFEVTLAAGQQGKLNHYFFTFETGSTPPTITWPSLSWEDGEEPTLEANKHYSFSILDGAALYACTYNKIA